MMRVTVEIWPGGDPTESREMVCMDISNISELAPVSDYVVEACLNVGQSDQKKEKYFVTGHVRDYGWATLVGRAMKFLEPLTDPRRSQHKGAGNE